MENLRYVIGKMVRQERTAKSWTQQQLADATCLKRTTVSNIEAGRQSLTLEQFCLISDILGKDAGEMLTSSLVHLTTDDYKQKVQKIVERSAKDDIIQRHVLDALK